MADMTPTLAFAHAPSTAARDTLRGAFDTLFTAIDTCRTTASTGVTAIWTAAISGSPTGGTYTLTFTGSGQIAAQTISLAFNASAATVQTAIRALVGEGFSQATVTASGTTPNFTHTITFRGMREAVTITRSVAGLTGGTPALALTNTQTYAAIPRLSAQSVTMAKNRIADVCELIASDMRN